MNIPQKHSHHLRPLLHLSWLLAGLLLIVLWATIYQGLHWQNQLHKQAQQQSQASWLQDASQSIRERLDNLQKTLRLFENDKPSLARDATELNELYQGKLWLLDDNGSQQLRGPSHDLPDAAQKQAWQWLQRNQPDNSKMLLLPRPDDSLAPADDQLLQFVLPQCQADECKQMLTGFIQLDKLIDPQEKTGQPDYALMDLDGHLLAHYHHPNSAAKSPKHFQRIRLQQQGLILAASYQERDTIRQLSLLTISIIGAAFTISALLLLLIIRVSQILTRSEHHEDRSLHAQQLLALSNNSLRDRMRQLLDEQHDQQTLIETVQAGVLIVDAQDLSIITCNESVSRMLGTPRQGLQQQSLPELFLQTQYCHDLLDILKTQHTVNNRETALHTQHNQPCWSLTSMRYLRFRDRQAIAISLIDITERIMHAQRLQNEKQATERALAQLQATQHELYQRATRDDLTGLHNRRHFMSFATKALDRARLTGEAVSVALVDLDHFKQVNDRYGHAAGDAALKHFAANLAEALPQGAMAGRMGGEEFAILLPDMAQNEGHAMVDSLRSAIASKTFISDGNTLSITFSAGIACFTSQHPQTLTELLKRGDQALYQAKANGRNRIESAPP